MKIPDYKTNIRCDLNLDQVAMVIHSFLKRLDKNINTLVINVEKVEFEQTISNDEKELVTNAESYTVTIITSYDKLTNSQLIKIYEKLQNVAVRKRGCQ